VVAETYDGFLNDIDAFHLTVDDVNVAIADADAHPDGIVAEGNVGGGTGMICHEFKGGIGTPVARAPQRDRADLGRHREPPLLRLHDPQGNLGLNPASSPQQPRSPSSLDGVGPVAAPAELRPGAKPGRSSLTLW
jgi:hypothetical protein